MRKFLFFIAVAAFTGLTFAQTSVEFKITQPAELSVDLGDDVSIVAGGSAEIGNADIAQGGTPDYVYSWNPADNLSDNKAPVTDASPSR